MNEAKILISLCVAILMSLGLTACSTGGYVQIGWIPVNDVNDIHRNVGGNKNEK